MVEYLPGEENLLPDVLSRWANPASQALADLTKHGSIQDDIEMQALIEEENADEKLCMVINLGKDFPPTQGDTVAPRNKLQGICTQGGPS